MATITPTSSEFLSGKSIAFFVSKLAEYDCNFHYDEKAREWFLSGTDKGLAWETDNYAADDIDSAMEDALYYLETY